MKQLSIMVEVVREKIGRERRKHSRDQPRSMSFIKKWLRRRGSISSSSLLEWLSAMGPAKLMPSTTAPDPSGRTDLHRSEAAGLAAQHVAASGVVVLVRTGSPRWKQAQGRGERRVRGSLVPRIRLPGWVHPPSTPFPSDLTVTGWIKKL